MISSVCLSVVPVKSGRHPCGTGSSEIMRCHAALLAPKTARYAHFKFGHFRLACARASPPFALRVTNHAASVLTSKNLANNAPDVANLRFYVSKRAKTTRSRPFKSEIRRVSAPAFAKRLLTAGPCSAPISTSTWPFGMRRSAAPAAI